MEDIKLEWNTIKKLKSSIDSMKSPNASAENILENMENTEETEADVKAKEKANKKERPSTEGTFEKKKRAYELSLQGKTYTEIAEVIGCWQNETGIYIQRYKEDMENVKLD